MQRPEYIYIRSTVEKWFRLALLQYCTCSAIGSLSPVFILFICNSEFIANPLPPSLDKSAFADSWVAPIQDTIGLGYSIYSNIRTPLSRIHVFNSYTPEEFQA